MCDHQNVDAVGFIVNTVDHPPIADTIAQVTRPFTFEPLDGASVPRIPF